MAERNLEVGSTDENHVIRKQVIGRHAAHQLLQQDLPRLQKTNKQTNRIKSHANTIKNNSHHCAITTQLNRHPI